MHGKVSLKLFVLQMVPHNVVANCSILICLRSFGNSVKGRLHFKLKKHQ